MEYLTYAIMGFFAGLFSTFLMTLFELLFWTKWGLKGIFEWHENQILFSKLLRKDPDKLIFHGIFLLHFLNGGLGGTGLFVFVGIFPILVQYAYTLGLGYAIFLWVLTLLPIHKPITGIDPLRHPQGIGPLLASLAGHVIYGISLSLVLLNYSL
jgi:hypothetical protein